MIENERIRIYPACKEQMENFILAEKDEEMKSFNQCIDEMRLSGQ